VTTHISRLGPIVGVLASLAILGAACSRESPPPQGRGATQRDPVVMTTFYPATHWCERLLEGTGVPVVNPVPPDADPIFWRPGDEDIAAYQLATLIVTNGAEFEKWVATAALPRTRVVASAEAIEEPLITYETTTHAHGPGGEHTHQGVDGHTWVDPLAAAAQAGAIADALAGTFPQHADRIRENAAALEVDFGRLHERWQTLSPRMRGAALLASHPAYNYLARRYGLEVTNVDLDPVASLSEDDLDRVAEALRGVEPGTPAVLMWEGEPADASVAVLSERYGVVSVWVTPVESREAVGDGDYFSAMHANIDRLDAALPE
jgi:zinc transport system substrate-binding protein